MVAAGKTIKSLEEKLLEICKLFHDVIVFYVSPEKAQCITTGGIMVVVGSKGRGTSLFVSI